MLVTAMLVEAPSECRSLKLPDMHSISLKAVLPKIIAVDSERCKVWPDSAITLQDRSSRGPSRLQSRLCPGCIHEDYYLRAIVLTAC